MKISQKTALNNYILAKNMNKFSLHRLSQALCAVFINELFKSIRKKKEGAILKIFFVKQHVCFIDLKRFFLLSY
jgi:hypothetical protein